MKKELFLKMVTSILYFLNINFVFTSDLESVLTMALDDVWSQEFYDYVNFQTIIDDAKTYALYDALYGITYDFDVRLFLFEPRITYFCSSS